MKVSLWLTAVAATGVLLAAEEPELLNGGFESVDARGRVLGWTFERGIYSVDNCGGMNGTKALLFSGTANGYLAPIMQRVRVHPGMRYKFGFSVRTENLVGKGYGARICLIWEDQYGQIVGSNCPSGHFSGTADWRHQENYAKAPENAAWVTVRPEVVGPKTGKAWFDDVYFSLHEINVKPVLMSSCYRDEAADGEVVFGAGLGAAGRNAPMAGRKCEFSYLGADGQRHVVAASQVRPDRASVKLLVADLAMGCNRIGFRLCDAEGKQLCGAEMDFTRLAEPVRRRVSFDRRGRTIVDGKPFFPLGMYWSVAKPWHKKQHPKINADSLKTYLEGPFNCVLPSESPNKEQLDLLQAKKLMVIYALLAYFDGGDWDPTGKDPEKRHSPRVKKLVEQYKDHPAILAWYLNDERNLSEIVNLTGRRRTVRELDPDHPSWICVYQYEEAQGYLPTFDAFGTDPYPVPNKPLSTAWKMAAVPHDQLLGLKPMWQVPQAFDWKIFRGGAKDRMPTRREMRNMTWMQIAAGANGLIYYSYTYLMFGPTTDFETAWQDVKAVASEVRDNFDILLAGDEPPKFGLEGAVGRTWREGDRVFALVVNPEPEPTEARLVVEGRSECRRVIFGAAPENGPQGTLLFKMAANEQSLIEL